MVNRAQGRVYVHRESAQSKCRLVLSAEAIAIRGRRIDFTNPSGLIYFVHWVELVVCAVESLSWAGYSVCVPQLSVFIVSACVGTFQH